MLSGSCTDVSEIREVDRAPLRADTISTLTPNLCPGPSTGNCVFQSATSRLYERDIGVAL